MRFNLLDKILEITDDRIVAVKQVSLAEEYLADHFPTFPVLPGVMMLEALIQAAGWILHRRRNFECSMAILKEVRNVKYGRFVAPGDALTLDVTLSSISTTGGVFKAAGRVGEIQALSARIELAYFNLADRQSGLSEVDERQRQHNRARWALVAGVQPPVIQLN